MAHFWGLREILSAVLLLLSALVLLDTLRATQEDDAACDLRMNAWSPLLAEVERQSRTFDIPGFLVKSAFVGTPSGETEALWSGLIPSTRETPHPLYIRY